MPSKNDDPSPLDEDDASAPLDWQKCSECGRSIQPAEDVVIHVGVTRPVVICLTCYHAENA